MEYEFEIPFCEAKEIIENLCQSAKIKKVRYSVVYRSKVWEIDVFSGDNEGLVLAEVELLNENDVLELPFWVIKEVTGDERYYNKNLLERPFKMWGDNFFYIKYASILCLKSID